MSLHHRATRPSAVRRPSDGRPVTRCTSTRHRTAAPNATKDVTCT